MMTHSGPGFWVLSQTLLLLYFKMDNGSNVCGIEFNYNNEGREEENRPPRRDSLIGADVADRDTYYNDRMLGQLFLGFQVESEEGRSVLHCCQKEYNVYHHLIVYF